MTFASVHHRSAVAAESSLDAEYAVTCDGVVKCFGAVTALAGLDLVVPRGRVVGFLGPNGAGKSTTLRLLLDLLRPDAGTIRVLGHDPRRGPVGVRQRIGYLPGELRLDEHRTVGQILDGWAAVRGGVETAAIATLCDRLDLDPSRPARGLSSGTRRKVGLVGAFMGRPELLLLDEPTAGIDPLVQATFLELVEEVRADGRTVFLSSHVLSEVQRIADEAIVVRAGRAVAAGGIDELRRAARQRFSATFADAAPEAELRALRSVRSLQVSGREATGVVEGPPEELVRALAGRHLVHLVMPEPDLEDTFLRFYEEDR